MEASLGARLGSTSVIGGCWPSWPQQMLADAVASHNPTVWRQAYRDLRMVTQLRMDVEGGIAEAATAVAKLGSVAEVLDPRGQAGSALERPASAPAAGRVSPLSVSEFHLAHPTGRGVDNP